MAKMGTTMATGHKMKAASTSGVRHGPAVKNVRSSAAPRSAHGKGSAGATNPIKGTNRGGV